MVVVEGVIVVLWGGGLRVWVVMVMVVKKGLGLGGGVGGGKVEVEVVLEVWCCWVWELGGCS